MKPNQVNQCDAIVIQLKPKIFVPVLFVPLQYFQPERRIMKTTHTKGDDSDHHVELASGNVQLITSKESWEQKLTEATRDGRIVIANFSAAWCGPCKTIAPYYSELSEKFPSLMFLVVDVDEMTDFSSSWDIKATPTFFFLKNGQQIDKLVGANKPELQKKINGIAESMSKPQNQ
ncbi:thioredoxin H-type-like [Senna tora]|uniref:Thioredoxin H-type-like n=1 Tax=Senna tora TaxID=362788 RepID=A0A834TRU9_9FABA|nr:thioredoxin H-type-like [Senna tora]